MESLRYSAEGKGLVFSDEIDLSIDSFGRSRKSFTRWDGDSVENMEFIDLGFSEMPIKPFNGNNTGRLADGKEVPNSKFLKERSVLSSTSPNFQAKKTRTMSSRSQTPFCQVYGCHKDLSSLKDYNKRHKVCEVHSKTPKVIVNGVEQRFCQQCSRFHLLVEFDDGKRSCRKRLAGHNERRRKPQFGALSGTKYLGTSMPKRASFLFPNILPGGILYPERYEETNCCRPVKLEDISINSTNGHRITEPGPFCWNYNGYALHQSS